jgi:translocation and assembly module TamB
MVTLDLGSDFRVRGRGIDTKVAGELTLRSTLATGEAPTVTGALRTVGGQYKAYGQQLEIERGQMRFTGAYDNPSLDILAIRPKLTQRVGVQITGTALLPRVRLYAEPDLPEAEKLAWLVLGRSGANGGAETAVLQQAAFALLGGESSSGGIAGRLGLDELSVSGGSDVGSSGTSAATVTLGKRISQNFYVAYERSLAGTLGTFSIFYDLSERFTLRARTGEKSAVDLIYKYSYD